MSKYDTMMRIKGNNSVRGKPADFLLVAHFARPFFIKNILLGGGAHANHVNKKF